MYHTLHKFLASVDTSYCQNNFIIYIVWYLGKDIVVIIFSVEML